MERIGSHKLHFKPIDVRRGPNSRQSVWAACGDDVPEGHVFVPKKLLLEGALYHAVVFDLVGDTFPNPTPCLGFNGRIPAFVFSHQQMGIATNGSFHGARRFRLDIGYTDPPAGQPTPDALIVIASLEGQIRWSSPKA